MNDLEIKSMLDSLASLQAERDVINLKKQELINTILTDEIKAQIAEIESEFADKVVTVQDKINELESSVKIEVVKYGASVKASFLHAVYANGRVSWDTKGLDGFRVAHPEIDVFRKKGEPSVSLRMVK